MKLEFMRGEISHLHKYAASNFHIVTMQTDFGLLLNFDTKLKSIMI